MIIRPKLRLATNDDAKDIFEILDEAGQVPGGHDWSKLGPYWIVAEYDETIIGCTQVLCGKPFGFIGFCAVRSGYLNAGVGVYLWRAAQEILANHGCDGYISMTANEQVLKKAPKRGVLVFGDPVRVMFKRVYRKNNGL